MPETVDQPTTPDRKPFALWLVVMGVSLILLPLFLTAQTIQRDNLRLEAALMQAQTEAVSVPTLPAAAQNLQVTATAMQAQLDQLGPVYSTLAAAHVEWGSILALIAQYDDTQMVVTGVSQTENRLVITGRANADTAVGAYTQALEETGRFARVVIQSIVKLAGPNVTATPAATPTQPNAASTPQPIFIKQPLLLTFDVPLQEHSAFFLAKANRLYDVSTVKLAPGVDTYVTISLEDGPTYSNDDVGPGSLASTISFQAPAANTLVTIHVTNLGQAGPEMSYQLLVQEIVPRNASGLATSTPLSAATLDASSTVTPTPTASPTAPPTATLPPPTLAASGGAVTFTILVEVGSQTP